MSDQKGSETCFVVSPIGPEGSEIRTHADWVFGGIIEPVFKEHFSDFNVERSDHISTPGQINTQVIERLLNSRLVIADLSMLNANVFYEVGIRHMSDLPIIHMQREDDPIPFDVASYRSLKFSLKRIDDISVAKIRLHGMIADVLKVDHIVSNPVIEARGRAKFKESASNPQQIILDEIDSVNSRVNDLTRLVIAQGK